MRLGFGITRLARLFLPARQAHPGPDALPSFGDGCTWKVARYDYGVNVVLSRGRGRSQQELHFAYDAQKRTVYFLDLATFDEMTQTCASRRLTSTEQSHFEAVIRDIVALPEAMARAPHMHYGLQCILEAFPQQPPRPVRPRVVAPPPPPTPPRAPAPAATADGIDAFRPESELLPPR